MIATDTIEFPTAPVNRSGPVAVLRQLSSLPPYTRWEGDALPAELDHWVRHEATEQELLSLGATVLTRLMRITD